MTRLSNILVGIDLHHGDRIASDDVHEAVHAALAQAAELAQVHGAQVTLCAVLELSEQAHHLIEADPANVHRTVEDAARKALDRLAERLRGQGVKVEALIRFGQPWEELSRQVIAGRHDLVVVGVRARGTVARLVFGSTTQQLIRVCPAPVWIVKPGEVREIREVLLASDFSDAAQAATQAAVQVAQALRAKLFVVHALEFPFEAYLRTAGTSEEQVDQYRERLRFEAQLKLQEQLTKTDYRTLPYGVKIEVIEGLPDAVIPRFIDENEVDVLVIGTYGRTGFAGVFLGNTAERLLPHVHSSLLVTKPIGFVSPVQPVQA